MQSGCSKQRRLISPANLGERLSLQQVAMGDVHYVMWGKTRIISSS